MEVIIGGEELQTNPPEVRLFSTDLDGTLLDQKNNSASFGVLWKKLPPEDRPVLCYNTGRMTAEVRKLVNDGILPEPDFIISGVGTAIFDFHSDAVLKEFTEILDEGWNADLVERVLSSLPYPLTRQPAHFQNDYKSSWYLDNGKPEQISEVEVELEAAGLDVHVVYSSARHLDVLPRWANKGNALQWLLRHLDIPSYQALVAGDSGNDSAMFYLPRINGIVVGNAQPELIQITSELPIYHAPPEEVGVQAVLNGLVHYGVFDQAAVLEQASTKPDLLYESILLSAD